MNRQQKRMEDLREAKDRKMKKVAVGLSVVLAVVLAFEVPKVLNGGPKASSAPLCDHVAFTTLPSPETARARTVSP